jgi:ATP-dependent Clp protease ATP-binding subunit ClpB
MRAQIAGMKTHWEDEKRLIQNIRTIKEAQEQLGIDEQRAEREGNLARVAELRYGRSNELKANWSRPIRTWSAPGGQEDAQGRGG